MVFFVFLVKNESRKRKFSLTVQREQGEKKEVLNFGSGFSWSVCLVAVGCHGNMPGRIGTNCYLLTFCISSNQVTSLLLWISKTEMATLTLFLSSISSTFFFFKKHFAYPGNYINKLVKCMCSCHKCFRCWERKLQLTEEASQFKMASNSVQLLSG